MLRTPFATAENSGNTNPPGASIKVAEAEAENEAEVDPFPFMGGGAAKNVAAPVVPESVKADQDVV